MPKTHYLGRASNGAPVGRASQSDYGFRFAACKLRADGRLVRLPNFSTTREGAIANAKPYYRSLDELEVVAVEVVDGKTYREAMKAAK